MSFIVIVSVPPASSSLNSHRRTHSESDMRKAPARPKKERSFSTENSGSPVVEEIPPNDKDPPEVSPQLHKHQYLYSDKILRPQIFPKRITLAVSMY